LRADRNAAVTYSHRPQALLKQLSMLFPFIALHLLAFLLVFSLYPILYPNKLIKSSLAEIYDLKLSEITDNSV